MLTTLKNIYAEDALPMNYVRFYFVGLLLYIIPPSRPLFIFLTAPSLLLVTASLIPHHRNFSLKQGLLFSSIIIGGFTVEMLGVNTGIIFGEYEYLNGLGPKINHTPIIIGINWLLLVYSSHSITSTFIKNKVLKIVTGALLMVGYDLVVELIAPQMNMWQFKQAYPPINNFIAWYLLALLFHFLLEVGKVNTTNKPAKYLFVIQLAFFIIIAAYHQIFTV